MSVRYELLTTDGAARRGRVHTPRGSYETPVFMPVGTKGAIVRRIGHGRQVYARAG